VLSPLGLLDLSRATRVALEAHGHDGDGKTGDGKKLDSALLKPKLYERTEHLSRHAKAPLNSNATTPLDSAVRRCAEQSARGVGDAGSPGSAQQRGWDGGLQ
jgi:hypothetical protein